MNPKPLDPNTVKMAKLNDETLKAKTPIYSGVKEVQGLGGLGLGFRTLYRLTIRV